MSRLKGSTDLERRLLAIPLEVLAELRPALVKGAQDIADAMEQLAPEDTGDLVNTISVTGPGGTTPAYASGGGSVTLANNQAAVTVGSPDMRHGHLQEFGTVNHEAQPFMRPAFRLKKAKVMARISRAVAKAIKNAGDGK
ncbi:HK97 gp10 family phage protein [Sulfitobacter sp. M39]|uniref:HK97-gp10 family putative phage morphogenesis protein n=1 Tax=Sulfitobacter sp. M39 TaxID=2675334 RepID=UPI001F400543|nr:HK97-gp10 family putative phage morphogenesis protein [Sulfitobacter sp. M39]MCF7747510.1 HK97 gp10 family phage protein [Sulfitobacter sp. M39]